MHHKYEWDPAKAEANLRKHGVHYLDAVYVLSDEQGDRFHLDMHDYRHAEDRWVTFAPDPDVRSVLYVIVWTPRGGKTRIISARFADPKEKRFYEQNLPTNPES